MIKLGKVLRICFVVGSIALLLNWSVATGETQDVNRAIARMELSDDEHFYATITYDRHIQLWDAASSELLYEVQGPDVSWMAEDARWVRVEDIEFSSDSEHLAISFTGSGYGVVWIVAVSTGELIHEISEAYHVGEVSWNPTGVQLAVETGTGLGTFSPNFLTLWNVVTETPVMEFQTTGTGGVEWSPDGTYLLYFNGEHEIVILDTVTWQPYNVITTAAATPKVSVWNSTSTIVAVADHNSIELLMLKLAQQYLVLKPLILALVINLLPGVRIVTILPAPMIT
jgi:WD40 repeat protein